MSETLPWLFDRQAQDVLAAGYRKAYASTDGEIARLRHQSPEARVVRLQYEGNAWQNLQAFYAVVATIRVLTDASETVQKLIVPWQGVALAVPAGTEDLALTTVGGLESRPGDPEAQKGTLLATISHGYLSRQCRQVQPSIVNDYDDGWYQNGPEFDLLPPPFATCVHFEILEGDVKIVSPYSQISVYMPAPRAVTLPIPLPGWIKVAGGSGPMTVLWEVSL